MCLTFQCWRRVQKSQMALLNTPVVSDSRKTHTSNKTTAPGLTFQCWRRVQKSQMAMRHN
jgi:hypothetical protein